MTDIECGASTHTLAREKLASFSTTFYVSETRLMVHADSGIRSFDDLAGKTVLTASGSAAERLVKQTALQRNLVIRQVQSRSQAESMAMLERGEVDVYVADDATLAALRAQSTAPERYVLLDDSLSVEPYALVLPKDDPAFKAMVDETLVDLMKSGELEKIYSKWFTQPIPPTGKALNLPLSALNKSTWQFPNDKPAN
jgi:glutamate/aspartate transport system substrate-binding protein